MNSALGWQVGTYQRLYMKTTTEDEMSWKLKVGVVTLAKQRKPWWS
ncbi:MAG: hypothetical protein AAFO06_06220 [Cyanobacteria bacterium J06597_16]